MDILKVKIGNLILGPGEPVRVQTMTNTPTNDIQKTIEQISDIVSAGAEIVRLAVPDLESAAAFKEYKAAFPGLPLVADIHFDHRLALESIKYGADKIRINPGNIGSEQKVKEVCNAAADRGIPLRVGVNGGSLPKDLERKYGGVTPEAMVEAAERELTVLERSGFTQIVFSLKSSDVPVTVEANRLFRSRHPYPLHIGITEAGLPGAGTVLSSVGMGIMLYEGIGETIRVSLTGDPVNEIKTGWMILSALGMRKRGIKLISCPTCGRTEIPVEKIARAVETRFDGEDIEATIAVMGCIVNGPGEARHADIGITGTAKEYIIFRRNEIVDRFSIEFPIEKVIEKLYGLLCST